MPPKVPVELQLLVLQHAADGLQGSSDFAANLAAFSLVSPAWQIVSQAKLFETVVLARGDRSLKFYDLVARVPRIGGLVKSITIASGFSQGQQYLDRAHLLPSLRQVSQLSWKGDIQAPPGRDHRPTLRSLSIITYNPHGSFSPPSDWFDLTSLREFELFTQGGVFNTEAILRDLPNDLQSLSLRNVDAEDLSAVLAFSRRFADVTTLKLVVWRSTMPLPADVLEPYPRLRHLTVAHDNLGPALDLPLQSLETLTVSMPPDDWAGPEEEGYPEAHPVRKNIIEIARIVKEHPKRFPSLRTVGLLPPYEKISFVTPAQRDTPGLGAMATKLAEAGLGFVDSDGLEWGAC